MAISYPINTFLQDYTSVPWDHYKTTSGAEKMLAESELYVYNSHNTAILFSPGQYQSRYEGVLQGGSPFAIPSTGILEPGYQTGQQLNYFDVASLYSFDQSIAADKAEFDVKVNIADNTDGSNIYPENDTTYFTQRFSNYYAYDDGTAEAGYGIEGSGSLMAYKFDAYQSGALTGILMRFVPTVTNFEDEVFLLTVWADNGGEPGEIIYQDDFFASHTPDYNGAREGFKYYTFNNTAYLTEDGFLNVDETFYVGWQNVSSFSLNIGLDWNINNGDKVFRKTGESWLTSSFDISLLIRPVFSTALDGTLAAETRARKTAEINVYPNPANQQFSINGVTESAIVRLFDMSGRIVLETQTLAQVDVSFLEQGVYLVDIRNNSGEKIHATRLIKH